MVPSRDRTREAKWIDENRAAYADQWVAVEGDRLIAAGVDPLRVFADAKGQGVQKLREFVAKRVSFIKSEKQICADIAKQPAYCAFVMQAVERMPWLTVLPKDEVHEWRSIAMSLMTPDEKHTVYRFMFISLLNLGAGTVCFILGLSWTLATLALRVPWLQPWGSTLFPQRRPLDIGVFLAGIILAYFFFERRKAFYPRALRVPFTMAIVKLGAENVVAQQNPHAMLAPAKPSVYLAGGMHSRWQDRSRARACANLLVKKLMPDRVAPTISMLSLPGPQTCAKLRKMQPLCILIIANSSA